MVKLFIFDVGSVITTGSRYAEINARISKVFKVDKSEIHRSLAPLYDAAQNGRMSSSVFWKRFAEGLGVDSPKRLRAEYTKVFMDRPPSSGINPGVRKVIKLLKRRGYKVVALSNTVMTNEPLHRELGHYKHLDRVFLSHRIKAAKPDKRAFLHVLKTMKITPKDAVFIDDQAANVGSARRLGIHAILFKNTGQLKKELRRYLA